MFLTIIFNPWSLHYREYLNDKNWENNGTDAPQRS